LIERDDRGLGGVPLLDSVDGEIDLRSAAAGRRRLVDDVISHLRQLILDQELPPGTALLQTELAEKLGVSRTPLREAFRILEREGLVKVANGNRTIEVARFGAEELRDLYEMREVIDGLAARLLARKGLSEEADAELRGLLAEMDLTAEPFQPSRWFQAHLGFHERIATCCGNSQLHSMLNLIRMTTLSLHGPLHDAAEFGPGELAEILQIAQQQHYAIYESIRDGDERSAESQARRHIRATLHSNLIEQATRGTGHD
jgi:GntR family transcriptional regulator, vanillate catabolism transcriptional regulator